MLYAKSLQMSSVIGFDYGEQRIGVAVGLIEVGTANPLTTIKIPTSRSPWSEIDKIIQQWQPTKLVVGCVDHNTQNNNILKNKIHRFCENLKSRYHLPVETIDESYSSVTAYEILKDLRSKGQRKKINKADIDKASAAIILHSWLSSNLDRSATDPNK